MRRGNGSCRVNRPASLLTALIVVAIVGFLRTPCRSDDSLAIWLTKAESIAARIEEPTDRLAIWCNIAHIYAIQEDMNGLRMAVNNVQETQRDGCLQSIADRIAERGRLCLALRIVDFIKDPLSRDEAICTVAGTVAEQQNFVAAESLAARIKKPLWKSLALREIALGLAHAGQYQAAEQTILKCDTLEYEDLREAIDVIREAKRTRERSNARPYATGTVAERFRLQPWVSEDELRRLREELGEKTDNPEFRIDAWYRVAVGQKERGNSAGCQQSLANAIREVQQVSDDYMRVLFCVQITDLLIELGSRKQAVQFFSTNVPQDLLKTTIETMQDDKNKHKYELYHVLGAKAVGVLMRLGRMQQAFEIAERDNTRNRWYTYFALGAFGAVSGDTGAIEERLNRVGSDRDKAAVCMGVATGLEEKLEGRRS